MKEKAIQYFGNKCNHCLKSYEACVYDFHHINPKIKGTGLINLFHRSWENIMKELTNCIMLCANCHRLHHWRKNWNPEKFIKQDEEVLSESTPTMPVENIQSTEHGGTP